MSKPVLSELEYNASDVASAILENADLSVTNEDLGVSSITTLLTPISTMNIEYLRAYSFNGFVYVSARGWGDEPDDEDKIFDINDDYTPIENTVFPTVSHAGDTATYLLFKTNDEVIVSVPENPGHTNWNFAFNGWYRYTAV